MNILEKFLEYISIDTTSDSTKTDTPSTQGQLLLAKKIIKDLQKLNLSNIYFDNQHCYVYGILKGTEQFPKLGFVSHLDTSENAKGNCIYPNIIHNYNGEDISLNEQLSIKTDI